MKMNGVHWRSFAVVLLGYNKMQYLASQLASLSDKPIAAHLDGCVCI